MKKPDQISRLQTTREILTDLGLTAGLLAIVGSISYFGLSAFRNTPVVQERQALNDAIEHGSAVTLAVGAVGIGKDRNGELAFFRVIPNINTSSKHAPAFHARWIPPEQARNILTDQEARELFDAAKNNPNLPQNLLTPIMRRTFNISAIDRQMLQLAGILHMGTRTRA